MRFVSYLRGREWTPVLGYGLFVFIAFTLILLPVRLFGTVVGLLSVGYSSLAYGYPVGRRLPIDRPDVSSVVVSRPSSWRLIYSAGCRSSALSLSCCSS